MRILIVGGAGYIGSALTKLLLEKGQIVTVLDLLIYGDIAIREFYTNSNFELIRADFRDAETLSYAAASVDVMIHLGAIVGDPACSLDNELAIDLDMLATKTVAEVARECKVKRLVLSSTCSVYGCGENFLTEDSPLRPLSSYAKAKIASEWILQSMEGINFVILRFGTIFGLSGRPRFDLVLNILTAKAVKERVVPVFGGNQWRPFLHVEDAAKALLLVIEKGKNNEIYNVAAENRQIIDIGRIVANETGAELQETKSREDERNYKVNFDKIAKLGFKPSWTLKEGIHQVAQAILAGLDYQNPLWNNEKHLKSIGIEKLRKNYENSLC